MSVDRFQQLVSELCAAMGLSDPQIIFKGGTLEIDGFEVMLSHFTDDNDALYINFQYGTVTAGRTLAVFRLMLEANLTIYAQDQAQLGLDGDTGGIVLVVRVPMGFDIDGVWLAELLTHYASHGRYWRENIIESSDEMFEGIATGEFSWVRA